jgi:tRNA1(Val) A37 N6-methylase TrmN6
MKRKNGRNHGEVFTNLNIVKYILDEVEYLPTRNLKDVTILEPAAGQGAFAIEIINRLAESSLNFGFDFITAINQNIRLIELNKLNFEKLKTNIFNAIQDNGFRTEQINHSVLLNSNYLQLQTNLKFDCIVGNPPYIRHEVINFKDKSLYKKEYSTFKFRADLYILFYEKSLKTLSKKGCMSFISSNRWLFNQYGEPLRKMIATKYHLSKIINIEKANIFDEKVTAYPCITTIKKENGNITQYYESQKREININNLDFVNVKTPKNGSWQNLFLDYNINHHSLLGIEEQGFKIGIGIATGADRIFIKKQSEVNKIEKNRLIPLITSNSLKKNKINWDNSYVLNPFEKDNICDLNKFPHFKDYLNTHKDILLQRHIAKKNPNNWYRTIDKIKPDLLSKNKLLLPDLSGSTFLFIDEGKFYPHHNVYYITNEKLNKLKILACILMSDFIKDQLSQIGIRMNGGLPRFQAQTLKKLRIPNIEELDTVERDALITSYDKRHFKEMNRLINKYCTKHSIYTMAG